MRSRRVWTWLFLSLQLAGCELIADFDRAKLDTSPPDGSVTVRTDAGDDAGADDTAE